MDTGDFDVPDVDFTVHHGDQGPQSSAAGCRYGFIGVVCLLAAVLGLSTRPAEAPQPGQPQGDAERSDAAVEVVAQVRGLAWERSIPIEEQRGPIEGQRILVEEEPGVGAAGWVTVRTETARGTAASQASPAWPDARAGQGQRVGARQERYTVVIVDEAGNIYTTALPQAQWETFGVGQPVSATVRGGEVRSLRKR